MLGSIPPKPPSSLRPQGNLKLVTCEDHWHMGKRMCGGLNREVLPTTTCSRGHWEGKPRSGGGRRQALLSALKSFRSGQRSKFSHVIALFMERFRSPADIQVWAGMPSPIRAGGPSELQDQRLVCCPHWGRSVPAEAALAGPVPESFLSVQVWASSSSGRHCFLLLPRHSLIPPAEPLKSSSSG